jgi:hypothetical protein
MQDYEQPSLLQVHATEILLIIAIGIKMHSSGLNIQGLPRRQ